MTFVSIIENLACLVTYISFAAGSKVLYDIKKAGSSAQYSIIPFLAGFSCLSLWLNYSVMIEQWSYVRVNLFGLTVQASYIYFFMKYSNKEEQESNRHLLKVNLLVLSILVTLSNINGESLGGTLATLSSLVSSASPLASIKEVMRTRSTQSLPFTMILGSFSVSFLWFILGFLTEDKFIFLSNMVTSAISAFQLCLFAIYNHEPRMKSRHLKRKQQLKSKKQK